MARRNTDSFSARPSASKRKLKPRGKPFEKGNPYRVKAGTILNPTGKTRKLSEEYASWLKLEDEEGVSNAAKIARVVGDESLKGNDKAYKEMRQATEGDKQYNYDLSKATDEQLERIASGEEATHVLADTSASATPPEAETREESPNSDTPTQPVDSV